MFCPFGLVSSRHFLNRSIILEQTEQIHILYVFPQKFNTKVD